MAVICANSYNTGAVIVVHVSIPNQSLNLLHSSQMIFIEEIEQRREMCIWFHEWTNMDGVQMDIERKMNGDRKMEEVGEWMGEWMGGWGWMS